MPLVDELHIDPHTRIGIWKIEEHSNELRPKLIFSKSEEEFMSRVTNEARRTQWMASRVLLKQMLGTTDFVDLFVDKNGKPDLVNYDYQMSISHGKEYTAVILSDKYTVGIDIESIRPDLDRIKQKFMSTEELARLSEDRYLAQILIYWSAKEVLYKIYAKRKLDFRAHMGIDEFDIQDEGQLRGWVRKGSYDRYFDLGYRCTEDYILVYATDKASDELADHNRTSKPAEGTDSFL